MLFKGYDREDTFRVNIPQPFSSTCSPATRRDRQSNNVCFFPRFNILQCNQRKDVSFYMKICSSKDREALECGYQEHLPNKLLLHQLVTITRRPFAHLGKPVSRLAIEEIQHLILLLFKRIYLSHSFY